MSELIWELTGQPFVLPVMLTGHIWSFWKWNKLKFPCCSVVSVVASHCVLSFAELWSEILGAIQQEQFSEFSVRSSSKKNDVSSYIWPRSFNQTVKCSLLDEKKCLSDKVSMVRHSRLVIFYFKEKFCVSHMSASLLWDIYCLKRFEDLVKKLYLWLYLTQIVHSNSKMLFL